MKKLKTLLFILAILLCTGSMVGAVPISVDLSGAVTGSFIDGGGADFAQSFIGQTVVGTGISGNPSNPLTLDGSGGDLLVQPFSALGYSGNSILPQPGNVAPLSMLLESDADSISWIMGSAQPPSSVTIDFFGSGGSLVASITQALLSDYNYYNFGGFGVFSGLTIYDNNDAAGLRWMDIEYNSVAGVPEPASVVLLGIGLLCIAGFGKKRFIKK